MIFIKSKKILTSNGGTGINVYRGCTHGCIYCDSRSACYHTPVPFENIEVKENAAELLDQELSRKKKKCMIGTGSMCDPYMPCEKDLRISRKCLEVICNRGFGASVLTKSSLVLRDFDLLKKINQRTRSVLQMTLTTADDNLCKKIEPNVSTTSERFKVLMEAKKEGIPRIVWLTPFLPFINDTRENVMALLEMCCQAEVSAVVVFGIGLTLREGNREYFYKCLDKSFPGIKERYIKSFGSSYSCGCPDENNLFKIVKSICEENRILYKTKEVFEFMQKFEERDQQLSLF